MPADKRDPDNANWQESEFGVGSGVIDPVRRADRALLSPWELGMEIAALPKTFDKSMPDRPTVETTPVPRLAPGETEADRK